jgi:putative hydrolase of the HAD superfamily
MSTPSREHDLGVDPSSLQAVLFDVGGVFFIPHHDVLRDRLAALLDELPHEDLFHRAHYEGIRHLEHDHDDEAFWHGYNRRFVDALGVEVAQREKVALAVRDAWMSDARLWTRVLHDNVEGLHRIAAHYRTGIVSNADGTVAHELAQAGICQVGPGPGVCVEVIVDSTVVGVSKPDPAIFRHALEPMGLAPETCLYVGDTYRYDVIGARAAGVPVVLVDPYDLHPEADHPRVRSLDDLADRLGLPG